MLTLSLFSEKRALLEKCAHTSLQSKLVAQQADFFSKMVVDAVLKLDTDLSLSMIGMKKETGGSLQDSLFVEGVAFKKTFSYAGFEQQPKKLVNPTIAVLNVELELKNEKENAQIKIDNPDDYQKFVDAEWNIIYKKLEDIVKTGAKVHNDTFTPPILHSRFSPTTTTTIPLLSTRLSSS